MEGRLKGSGHGARGWNSCKSPSQVFEYALFAFSKHSRGTPRYYTVVLWVREREKKGHLVVKQEVKRRLAGSNQGLEASKGLVMREVLQRYQKFE